MKGYLPDGLQKEKRPEPMKYLHRRRSNVHKGEPAHEPAAPSISSRRLGTVVYFLGVAGLFVVGALLWVVENVRFEDPPALVRVPGLQAEVTVVWDGSGTCHLHGTSWEDLLRAQGWLHARDRLWQMELARLAGRGRLAELFGPLGLSVDKVIRTLGLHLAAAAQVERLPVKSGHLLQHYVDGINAYLASDYYRPPPELFLLGWTPEPWTPECSAVINGLFSLSLSANWAQETVRASLEADFGTEEVALLLPDSDEGPYIVTGAPSGSSGRQLPAPEGTVTSTDIDYGFVSSSWSRLAKGTRIFREVLGLGVGGVGSNSWAVSGRRSRSGKPLLANDPHLAAQLPSTFISTGLHVSDRHLVGIGIPGLPLIISGRTTTFAWGFTNTMADNQDLYIERPVEGDPDRYWFRGRMYPFAARSETLAVRWATPQVIEVRSTHHGPIVNGVLVDMLRAEEALSRENRGEAAGNRSDTNHHDVAGWLEGAPPIALRWTTLETGDELHCIISLLDVEGWGDLRKVFESYGSAGQNVIFADTSGFIGYQFTGKIPVRNGWDGSRPVPGWTGDYEWQGYIPFEQLPRLENPSDGIVVTANNRPLAPGVEPFLGRWWVPPHRARRIWERLAEIPLHTPETFEDIQRDVQSVGALEIMDDLSLLPPSGPYGVQAMAILNGWDGRLGQRGPGALYEAFMAGFFPILLEDEMGSDGLRDYLVLLEFYDGRYPVVRKMLQNPEASWWDDVLTEEPEGREAILERLWQRAWNEISERFGSEPERWRWGRMHRLTLRHPFGRIWLLRGLFNRGPFDMAGGNDTIYNSHFLLSDPYATQVVPAWRHIVELSSPPVARQILPSGNSGHFLSPGYDDHLDDWLAGRTRPAATTWAQVLEAEVRRMLMLP